MEKTDSIMKVLRETYSSVFEYDLKTRKTVSIYTNENYEKLTLEEYLAHEVYPEDLPKVQEFVNLENFEKNKIIEYRRKSQDGYSWVRLEAIRESKDTGFLTFKNINQEKTQIINLTDIIGEVYKGIWQVNLYNRKCTCIQASSELKNFFPDNCVLDRVIDRWLESKIHPNDREDVRVFLLERGLQKEGPKELDFKSRDILGNYQWLRLEIMNHKTNDSLFFAIKDVNDDIKSQREQMEYNKLYGKALGNIFTAIFEIDLNENIVYQLRGIGGTELAREQMPLTYTETLEYNISRYVFSDHRSRILHTLAPDSIRRNVKDNNASLSCDFLKKEEGRFQWYEITVRLFVTEEQTKYLLFLKNTDAVKSKEEEYKEELSIALINAQSANKAKTRFLTNMSHDIRTPMNAIIGMTDLAKTYINDKERVLDCLNKITSSSGHLLNLINDILDMSLIESGKLTLNESQVDVVKEMTDLLVIMRPQIEEKHIVVSLDTKGVTHSYVMADALKLNQIFMNIISNAIKFSLPKGEIDILVSEKEISDKNSSYEFRIRDYGIGMSEDFLKKLFLPFERARTSTNSKVEGTGLGMSITKNIVDMMKGNIEVDSKVNNGSTFVVTIVLEKVNEPVIKESVKDKEEYDFKGCRVLLVEDKALNMEITKDFLEQVGFEVHEAWDGQQAVNLFENNKKDYYDAIIMDIQMPTMDGYDATIKIRSLKRDDAVTIPIIAMTADVFTEDVKKSRMIGMNDHIAKPVNKSYLYKVLQQWCKRK